VRVRVKLRVCLPPSFTDLIKGFRMFGVRATLGPITIGMVGARGRRDHPFPRIYLRFCLPSQPFYCRSASLRSAIRDELTLGLGPLIVLTISTSADSSTVAPGDPQRGLFSSYVLSYLTLRSSRNASAPQGSGVADIRSVLIRSKSSAAACFVIHFPK